MQNNHLFEELRNNILDLPLPSHKEDREIYWVCKHRLGIGKTHHAGYELFFVGERLSATYSIVKKSLDYNTWKSRHGDIHNASRVALPCAPHFLAISVLIASECCREGIADTSIPLQDVFSKVEPIIDMALKRSLMSDETILGMLGELLLLERMLEIVSSHSEYRGVILDTWRGYTSSSRDFIFGDISIEVKTTSLSRSSHYINSLKQIELQETKGEKLERNLFLLSIGLTKTPTGHYSIATISESILDLLSEKSLPSGTMSPLQLRFLDHLRNYGTSQDSAYDHLTMQDQLPYAEKYATTFSPRLFKLNDPALQLLKRHELEDKYITPDSVKFQVDLPASINVTNPAKDWEHEIKVVVRNLLKL